MSTDPKTPAETPRTSPRAPGQVVSCGWCGVDVAVPPRGRVPKWCSDTCRHRAWEQRRAAASGLSAVEIKDRVVETVKTVTVVQHHRTEVPVVSTPQSAAEYAQLLTELAAKIDAGRIYDRDLPTLAPAIAALVEAMTRRQGPLGNPCW